MQYLYSVLKQYDGRFSDLNSFRILQEETKKRKFLQEQEKIVKEIEEMTKQKENVNMERPNNLLDPKTTIIKKPRQDNMKLSKKNIFFSEGKKKEEIFETNIDDKRNNLISKLLSTNEMKAQKVKIYFGNGNLFNNEIKPEVKYKNIVYKKKYGEIVQDRDHDLKINNLLQKIERSKNKQ